MLFTELAAALAYFANRGDKQRRIAAGLVSKGASIAHRHHYDACDDEEKFSFNSGAAIPWLAQYIGIDCTLGLTTARPL